MIKEENLKLEFMNSSVGVFKFSNLNEDLIDKAIFLGDETYEEFLEFVKFNNIKNVFYKYYYKDIEDYFVNIEDIDEDIQRKVKKRVLQHNREIENIDLTRPVFLLMLCKFEGDIYGMRLSDEWDLEYSEMETEIFIENIEDEFSKLLDEKENTKKYIQSQEIEEKKLKLEEIILGDDNFKACTNQALRRNYMREFLEKIESEEFYSILIKERHGGEDRSPAYLLVEVLWNKYKMGLK